MLYSVKSNMQSYQLWQLLVTKEQPKVALIIAWHSLILLVLYCLVTFCKKLHSRASLKLEKAVSFLTKEGI